MKLPKAIEILTRRDEPAYLCSLNEEKEAIRLGKEALKEKLEREKGGQK